MAHLPPGAPEYGTPEYGTPEDADHDDLAALDFSVAGDELGADDNACAITMFTVSNPPGTVTVTTSMDGRVHQIDLSPGASAMTETDLAEEIVVIAGLATQDARSAQYTVMLEGMREHGHDNVGTRDFLTRELDLPTPEQVQAARANLFAARYAGEE